MTDHLPASLHPHRPSGTSPRFSTDPRLTPRGLVGVLWRQRWMILGCTLTVVGLVAVYTWRARPVYEASSMLRFEHEQVNLPQLVEQLATENRISTEVEVLQGRTAASVAIDSLGLRATLLSPRGAHLTALFPVLRIDPSADTTTLAIRVHGDTGYTVWKPGNAGMGVHARLGEPVTLGRVTLALAKAATATPDIQVRISSGGAALRQFQQALRVSRPARDADLIQIRFTADDPEIAARVANLLADQLIASRQSELRFKGGVAVTFLTAQVDSLRTQLRGSEDTLQRYRERARAVDPVEQARTQVIRLAQVEADRGGLEAERGALASVMDQIREDREAAPDGPSPYRRLIGYPALLKNQAAGELLSSLSTLENERAILLRRRTWQDDDVKSLTARIGALDGQLKNIATTYLEGITSQVAGLDRVTRQFSRSLDSLPKKGIQTARLERDAAILTSLYTSMQTRLKEELVNQAMQDPSVRLVDRAIAADQPLRPKPVTNLALGLALGVLLGVSVALGRGLADRSIRSRDDVMHVSGLPVLGAFPRVPDQPGGVIRRLKNRAAQLKNRAELGVMAMLPAVAGAGPSRNGSGVESGNAAAGELARRLVLRDDTPGAYGEAFNQFQINLALGYQDRPLQVLVFTSPLPGEGKTLTATNYALTAAARGQTVLLIDADTRCGIINEVLGCTRQPGLTDVLADRTPLDEAIRAVAVNPTTTIALLPTGALLRGPSRELTLDRLTEVIARVRSRFDLVVIDSPPLNILADAALLGSVSDGVILVARAGQTQREAFGFAMDQLAAVGAPVIGTILNDIDLSRARYDDGTYQYLNGGEKYHGSPA
ncbi:MAG: polysaccharide biosynthesis tyrosine autokinase [Gemmatimonadales bacterium]